MGFYLKKSLNFGPLRINLSKSGIGASAGVKGARIGINPKGKKYLHAGRGGLYYRKSLENNSSPETPNEEEKSVNLWPLILALVVFAVIGLILLNAK